MTVLLVLFTLILFLVADYVVQRKKQRQLAEVVLKPIDHMAPALWHLTNDIGIAPNHLWMRQEADASITIGIDNVLIGVVGIPEKILLPKKGTVVRSGDPAIVLQEKGKLLRLQLPIDGRVTEINTALASAPALAKSHPYTEGWLLKITSPVKGFEAIVKRGEAATVWLKGQAQLMKEFLIRQGPHLQFATMQDGGTLVDGVLKGFDTPLWLEFQKEFLSLPVTNSGANTGDTGDA